MKVSILILFTLVFSFVSCTEDAIRSSISTGEATFVCVKEDRTLEYTRDDDPTENVNEVEGEMSYGTCEEFRNQSKDSFDSFRTGTCSGGVAYSDTNCKEEFSKTSLKKAFDCTLNNSTRIYGVSQDTSNTKRNFLVVFGESQCLMMNIAFDPENALQ
tara:strand:- start:87 stop:560 length:474 start_codon:yes stop_codon:yes gene_type:complete